MLIGKVKFVATVIPDGIEEGWPFDVIHWAAVISLAINFICCWTTFYLFIGKNKKLRNIKAFFGLNIGERVLFYTMVFNLFYGLFHLPPHAWMLHIRDNLPDVECAILAFLLTEFVIANSLLTTFAAANAVAMVVKRTKIPTGEYDWMLLAITLGLPLGFGIPVLVTGHYGPSGPWCSMDHRTELGPFLTNALGTVMILTFVSMCVCYGAVWFKLKQSASNVKGGNKYGRSARNMLMFVAAYLLQHGAFALYSSWMLFAHPPLLTTVAVTFFSNQGGICNLLIYVQLQKQKLKTGVQSSTKTSTRNTNTNAK